MGNRLALIWVILLPVCLCSQISVKTNLPPEIKIGSEITFDAKIWKGPIKNFSKYQLELPQGVKVSEVDCKTGSFSQDDNMVKIIWAITPSEDEFTITLKMNAGPDARGEKTLIQRYFYLEKGDKKALELAPINILFKDSTNLSEPKTGADKPVQAATSAGDDMVMQVHQLQKDSKEALEVGEKEKQLALQHLKEADESVAKAKAITNEAESKKALEKAMVARDKAESDLAMANRILVLAKTLSENAAEMEKLNQAVEGTGSVTTKKTVENEDVVKTKEIKPDIENEQKVKQNAITKGTKNAKGLYKPISTKSSNIQEVIQQVDQIKKDARDARDLGQAEKRKAEQKLSDAYDALKKAEYITEAEDKKMAIEKATKDKEKAEEDLEVATKVLTLSKSLEDNAVEIENVYNLDAERKKLAEAKNTPSISPTNKPASENKSETKSEPVVIEEGVTESQAKKDAEKLQTIFKEESPSPEKKPHKSKPELPKKESGAVSLSGTVYRVQVGSFVNPPDKSQFNAIGKVDVIKDGEKYKAYTGKCNSREEASALRDKIKGMGLDAFVVIFKDGVKQ